MSSQVDHDALFMGFGKVKIVLFYFKKGWKYQGLHLLTLTRNVLRCYAFRRVHPKTVVSDLQFWFISDVGFTAREGISL